MYVCIITYIKISDTIELHLLYIIIMFSDSKLLLYHLLTKCCNKKFSNELKVRAVTKITEKEMIYIEIYFDSVTGFNLHSFPLVHAKTAALRSSILGANSVFLFSVIHG